LLKGQNEGLGTEVPQMGLGAEPLLALGVKLPEPRITVQNKTETTLQMHK